NSRGGLPTRNYSSGNFDGKDKISGETIRDLNLSRNGDISHGCMPGCVIKCSNVYNDADEKKLVTPLEYETIALMGSNLGFDDPDVIARLNAIANDLGADSIEVGATLGVFGDAGLFQWGDADRAMELMGEMRQGTPLGRILGNGAGLAGKILGVERVPVAKNQAFAGYDPRAVKATGVTFATTPQGADHTCGNPIRANVDHTDPAGKMEMSREAQYSSAAYDTLGVCLFAGFGFGADPTLVPDLINGRYGWDVDETFMRELGRKVVLMEREFNRQAGFTPSDDRLPEWIRREQLSPTQAVFDVPEEELDSVFDA
ncbi:MAG: aldehyde ferredoxin oxidoreductase C-terminal domain-containing protein, partial [Anaerolineales bacterium]|nr:aldehyde ferredoxin oxidoreductase C-terminal domain-containing protein [Anaerolineales bacterium]